LDSNNFIGEIPSCFGELRELQQLYLFQNELSGVIPSEIEELTALSKSHMTRTPISKM
jgi:Leucine-rich repeat (LRR) protein